jgi:superfamily II DNA helicase RecQ
MYVVCTNEHLAAMVQNKCQTKADLQKINGLDEAKIEKYGQAFLNVLAANRQ